MFYPLSDLVWSVFFRGIGLGFLGGFVLIVLFFLTGGKLTPLTRLIRGLGPKTLACCL